MGRQFSSYLKEDKAEQQHISFKLSSTPKTASLQARQPKGETIFHELNLVNHKGRWYRASSLFFVERSVLKKRLAKNPKTELPEKAMRVCSLADTGRGLFSAGSLQVRLRLAPSEITAGILPFAVLYVAAVASHLIHLALPSLHTHPFGI